MLQPNTLKLAIDALEKLHYYARCSDEFLSPETRALGDAVDDLKREQAANEAAASGVAALDAPDSPGFWAFEGTVEIDPNDVMRFPCEVVAGYKEDSHYYVRTVWNVYPLGFFKGKWTRLWLPWQEQRAPVPALPEPDDLALNLLSSLASGYSPAWNARLGGYKCDYCGVLIRVDVEKERYSLHRENCSWTKARKLIDAIITSDRQQRQRPAAQTQATNDI